MKKTAFLYFSIVFLFQASNILYAVSSQSNDELNLVKAILQNNVETVDSTLKNSSDDKSLLKTRHKGIGPFHYVAKLSDLHLSKYIHGPQEERKKIVQDKLEISRLLIDYGFNVDNTDENGLTPLHTAVTNNFYELVDLFLESGADPNIADETGFSGLHTAALYNRLEVATLLLLYKANPNLKNKWGETPLSLAKKKNYTAMFKLLSGNNSKAGILYKVVAFGSLKQVETVLSKGTDVNHSVSGYTPLMIAVSNRRHDIALELLKKGAKPNTKIEKNGIYLLHLATAMNNDILVKHLLSFGAKIDVQDTNGNTPLLMAARGGFSGVFKILWDANANLKHRNLEQKTVLMEAAQGGNSKIVKLLIPYAKDINEKSRFGNTPLMFAVMSGNAENVNILIKNGANVNMTNKNGETALLRAAYYGSLFAVDILLANGAKKDLADKNGNTAQAYANKNNHMHIVALLSGKKNGLLLPEKSRNKLLWDSAHKGDSYTIRNLLEQGTDVNCREAKIGFTALMLASASGQLDTVRLLLEKGAAINAKNYQIEKTSLMYATEMGEYEVVKLLLSQGAVVDMKTSSGETALDFAVFKDQKKIAKLLKEHGL